jgi:hypothetical protein
MPRSKMETIPEPGSTRSILQRTGQGTVILHGPNVGLRYACGSCGAPLIDGVPGKYVVDLVLACNACGAFNESPGEDTTRARMTDAVGAVAVPPGRHRLTQPLRVMDRGVFASERALQDHPVPTRNIDTRI